MSLVLREARARRLAQRQGLELRKSRYASSAGTFQIIDPSFNMIVWCDFASQTGFGLDLEDVEEFLAQR